MSDPPAPPASSAPSDTAPQPCATPPANRDAPPAPNPTQVRLQKVLAQAGFGSRRKCDDLISSGRVQVNAKPAVLGQRVNPATDRITVDGAEVTPQSELVYYLLNKPAGVITTASDTHGRPTVLDGLPAEPRIFPVGRLDQDTEGLLLLTNDGYLAHRLLHPSFGVSKGYLVYLSQRPSPGALRSLRQGVELDDGITAPAKASLIEPKLLRLTVHEGRNRLVRRMCEQLGYPVRRLVRFQFGPLMVRHLEPGEWRKLTPAEVSSLERACHSDRENPAPSPQLGSAGGDDNS